ncbi:uncharacterized protein LOC118433974 [Folsomia candida]|uniref:uncharacterized protein LOC118433974 n=1 Tax=Folsomia candida TaxID=158441 RepID=UPI001605239B|nr:uncharacterized protein LOC118433974 [Folsomia candida]
MSRGYQKSTKNNHNSSRVEYLPSASASSLNRTIHERNVRKESNIICEPRKLASPLVLFKKMREMDFLKRHVMFRLKNALLTKAYRMNLLTFEVLCAFCIVPFKMSWEEEKVVEVRGKLRRTVTKFMYLFHLGRTFHFLVGFGLRMAGLQVGPSGEYVMSDKLLDYGWMGPIMCTILFRFELTRKSKEMVKMMNEAHKLEREAEKEGLNTIYIKGFFGKAWQVYTYSAYSCVFSVPMAAGMFSMLNPCEPAFISWQFLPCNSTTWVPSTDQEHRIVLTSGVIETFFCGKLPQKLFTSQFYSFNI